ncbi:hypothetical protein HIM_03008 [Hirsutella minnesotensis 3608]|nr:hypothetical protein HIM_03008 [Hirsutella minnesotensis 3608]
MAEPRPFRDWAYFGLVSVQLMGMLALDLVPFYPKALWEPPSSPLHALVALRTWYAAFSNDPYFSADAAHEPWFRLFVYLEGLVQLPMGAYLAWRLVAPGRSRGPVELAALVFGCITALGSGLCSLDLLHMGADRIGEANRRKVLYGTYLPFTVASAIMTVDMYLRLLSRVQGDGAPEKTKKKAS